MEGITASRPGREVVKQIGVFCAIALLIFAGVYSPSFIIVAASLCFMIVVFKDLTYALELLFFLLPMAPVFKLSFDAASFFSYIALLFVVKAFFLKTTFSGTIVGVLLMAAYLLGGSLNALARSRDILLCLVICYLVMSGDVRLEFEKMIVIFSAGVLISALASLAAQNTPVFAGLAYRVRLTDVQGDELSRFRGLYGNSNYYTLDITMLVSCVMSLYCGKEKLSKKLWAMLASLLAVGVLSGSFSFLLTTAFTMLATLLYLTRRNLGVMIRTSAGFIAVMVVVFMLMGVDARKLITYRVESQIVNAHDLSQMTTGRSEVQAVYLRFFWEHIKTVLLGDGLGAPNLGPLQRGAHNTFIDTVYYFGIVGSAVYVGALLSFMRVKVRFTATKPYQWIPAASLLVRLVAISLLYLNNITFYYLMIWLSFTQSAEEEARHAAALCPAFEL